MQNKNYILQLFSCMFFMLLLVGFFQSWNLALSIFNLCIISAIMSLGINIQWGNAGIVNFGVMGFAALGGLANVIISMPPTYNAWEEGGILILSGIVIFIISIFC
jgi:branched-chain amino acid transport system permease protein